MLTKIFDLKKRYCFKNHYVFPIVLFCFEFFNTTVLSAPRWWPRPRISRTPPSSMQQHRPIFRAPLINLFNLSFCTTSNKHIVGSDQSIQFRAVLKQNWRLISLSQNGKDIEHEQTRIQKINLKFQCQTSPRPDVTTINNLTN